MYCQFGQKWAKLHHGPMWCVTAPAYVPDSNARGTMQVSGPTEETEQNFQHYYVYQLQL